MKIGVLGTGMVGEALASALVKKGHSVMMGSRQKGNDKAKAWAASAGANASEGSFGDAAAFGELLINATKGEFSLDVLNAAGAASLKGKIVLDASNPLDFSKGMPPTLTVANTDSLAEQIQRNFPEAKVVKVFNTLNAGLMVAPQSLKGDHTLFICGNDLAVKAQVIQFLAESFGWKEAQILDVGDITAARATESLVLLWVRIFMKLGHPNFQWHVNIGPKPA